MFWTGHKLIRSKGFFHHELQKSHIGISRSRRTKKSDFYENKYVRVCPGRDEDFLTAREFFSKIPEDPHLAFPCGKLHFEVVCQLFLELEVLFWCFSHGNMKDGCGWGIRKIRNLRCQKCQKLLCPKYHRFFECLFNFIFGESGLSRN